MKKTFSVIILIFLVIIVCLYMNYKDMLINKNSVRKFNKEYEFYNKEAVIGKDIIKIINKAINSNEKFNIEKDVNDLYIPNDSNSIKIYIIFSEKDNRYYPMESLIQNNFEDFTKYFGGAEFKCVNVKYHEKTGQIAEMIFSVIE